MPLHPLVRRYERLEEQLNDLTELHQNEMTNLKQELASMEEKVAYQSYERARDIQVGEREGSAAPSICGAKEGPWDGRGSRQGGSLSLAPSRWGPRCNAVTARSRWLSHVPKIPDCAPVSPCGAKSSGC